MWKLSTAAVTDTIVNCLNIFQCNLRVLPENYAPNNQHAYNTRTLFKLSKYIRLTLAKRSDSLDLFLEGKVPPPSGMNCEGTSFELPAPLPDPSVHHLGLTDVLVSRMKRRLLVEDKQLSKDGAELIKHAVIPKLMFDVKAINVWPAEAQSGVYTKCVYKVANPVPFLPDQDPDPS